MEKNVEKNKGKNILFRKVCEEWLNIKENTIKESSLLNYKFTINKHIIPKLGNMTLTEIEKYDFSKFIKNKKKELENSSISNLIIILKSIIKYAIKKYKIEYDIETLKNKKENRKEVEIFNEYEREKLTKNLLESKDDKDLGILISLYSGLRIGEICGLKWKDIDLENKIINVRRTVQRVYLGKKDTKIIISSPKSINSLRKIPISKIILETLKEKSKKYTKNAFLLTGEENKCIEPIVYRYTYKKILKKYKIKYKKYHCLRHTFATKCIRVGMDIKSLSEVLGHSDIKITLTTYVHSSLETKKKYIDKL